MRLEESLDQFSWSKKSPATDDLLKVVKWHAWLATPHHQIFEDFAANAGDAARRDNRESNLDAEPPMGVPLICSNFLATSNNCNP